MAGENGMGYVERKLEGLKEGNLTDCMFLVGPDEQNAQIFHACKLDLTAASEYFVGLLRSPFTPAGPIRIRHVQPHIFKSINEFAHTGQIVSELDSLEEIIELALTADEYLMNNLHLNCLKKLEQHLTAENVWQVFNKYHSTGFVASACEKLLLKETTQCLESPFFLQIDEEVLSKFLAFDNEKALDVQEFELAKKCLDYAEAREDSRAVFRRAALPHLRLLTMDMRHLGEVAPYLDLNEKQFLVLHCHKNCPLLINENITVVDSLCLNEQPRNDQMRAITYAPHDRSGYAFAFIPQQLTRNR